MQKDYKKLIFVSANNNNKFYEMVWEGGSDFKVKYGRVELTEQTLTYPYSKWTTKYNEKIAKGYTDVTEMVSVETSNSPSNSTGKIDDAKVEEFIKAMKTYMDNLVSTTYSVKADKVSQKQIDEAQMIINTLTKSAGKIKVHSANEGLIRLYTIIPRKMGNVKDYLVPSIKLENILEQEQDNLDAMAAQVSMIKPKAKKDKKVQNLLERMGITMKEVAPKREIQYLVDQCKQGVGAKINTIFEVNNPAEDKVFKSWMDKQKNKQTRVLIHGTRCSSVIPILEIGLKIRPKGNFQFSGKVYGDGNYYSETVRKSLNYTGWDKDKILLVYEVHTGNPFKYSGWYNGNSFPLTYSELQKRGFDSTFVSAGNGLLNSEIIAYREEQCRIKYIIWLK